MLIQKSILFSILKENYWTECLTKCFDSYKSSLEDHLSLKFLFNQKHEKQLKKELYKLRIKGKRELKKGGRQYNKYLKSLEKLHFRLDCSLDRHTLNEELRKVKAEKDELLKENVNLKEKFDFVAKQNEKLSQKISSTIGKENQDGEKLDCKLSRRRKPFETCTPSHQSKVRKLEIEHCKESLSVLENSGCKPVSVDIIRNGKKESLLLLEDEDDDDVSKINTLVYIVDSFNICRQAYHEISMLFKSLPRSYKLSEYISTLNKTFELFDTPDGLGVQQSLRKQLKFVVSELINRDKDFPKNNYVLKVKVSGDGTRVGKHLNFINFTFTIMNEERCGSAQGNYPLIIVQTKERYEELSVAVLDLKKEISNLQGTELQIGEHTFKVKIYLGGDYKFLLLCAGITSIQASYNCIYCKCSRQERGNMDIIWSLSDVNYGARINYNESGVGNSKTQYSMTNKPLFDSIPLHDVVIDNLHLFLRIIDKLIALLVSELRMLDNIGATSTFKSGLNKEKLHIGKLENILAQMGITFQFSVNKDTSKLQYTDLQGPDKEVLLQNIEIQDLGLDSERSKDIQNVWDGFKDIHNMLKSRSPDPEVLQEKITFWCSSYTSSYQCKDVTPYMHLLRYHVVELIRLHGNLVNFTQQGLEKANDNITKQFFRGTNFKGNAALRQIFEKQNRMFMNESSKRWKKWTVKCSSCKKCGHRNDKCPLK